MDASAILTVITSFLSGGVVGSVVTYRIDLLKARRDRRIKMIDQWRSLLTDEMCHTTTSVAGMFSRTTFPGMKTEGFASLYPHLSPAFKARLESPVLTAETRREWPRDYLMDEIAAIERRWDLI